MGTHTLLGLSGALRAGSTNRKLLREAARLFDPASY
ncbi:MAG: NADPH-dependent FMN reductase, partial [Rhodobacteraceae bacterium]